MGGSMDMRGGQSKKSDQAGQDIAAMGKSEYLCFERGPGRL